MTKMRPLQRTPHIKTTLNTPSVENIDYNEEGRISIIGFTTLFSYV